MTNAVSSTDKSTSIKLSVQVKQILIDRGLSKIFNYDDYHFFKRQCVNCFDKAHAIAELFINENAEVESDYSEYIF